MLNPGDPARETMPVLRGYQYGRCGMPVQTRLPNSMKEDISNQVNHIMFGLVQPAKRTEPRAAPKFILNHFQYLPNPVRSTKDNSYL
ncbi:MAG: hypothetical protein GYA18_09535 [Chloroflexi bacterium]|nr:hypothetical protein [Chloroflexota bacterium]